MNVVRRLTYPVLILALVMAAMSLWAGGSQERSEGQITLGYWYQTQNAHRTMVEQFQRQHPNVRIETSEMNADRMNQVLNNALASGEGPDLMYANLGVNMMGPLMEAGLVVDHHVGLAAKSCDVVIGERAIRYRRSDCGPESASSRPPGNGRWR